MAGYVEDHSRTCTAKGTKAGGAKKGAEKSAAEGAKKPAEKGAEAAEAEGAEEDTEEGAEKAAEKDEEQAEEITIGVVITNQYHSTRGPSLRGAFFVRDAMYRCRQSTIGNLDLNKRGVFRFKLRGGFLKIEQDGFL